MSRHHALSPYALTCALHNTHASSLVIFDVVVLRYVILHVVYDSNSNNAANNMYTMCVCVYIYIYIHIYMTLLV